MRKPIGISLEIGRDDRGWFAYAGKQKLLHIRPTRNDTNARYGGLKLDLSLGTVRRPWPKVWKKEYYARDYMTKEPVTNPWNSGNHAFTLLPAWFPPLPTFFLSMCYGAGKKQPGFYIGFKTYEVNTTSQGLGRYDAGNPQQKLEKHPYPATVAWGSSKEIWRVYLAFSLSVRGDLVDG